VRAASLAGWAAPGSSERTIGCTTMRAFAVAALRARARASTLYHPSGRTRVPQAGSVSRKPAPECRATPAETKTRAGPSSWTPRSRTRARAPRSRGTPAPTSHPRGRARVGGSLLVLQRSLPCWFRVGAVPWRGVVRPLPSRWPGPFGLCRPRFGVEGCLRDTGYAVRTHSGNCLAIVPTHTCMSMNPPAVYASNAH
jgi:hypothetical protein